MERLTERKWKSNKPEPLPCPCCDSDDVQYTENKPKVVCKNCGLTTGEKASLTIAIGVWNRRPIRAIASQVVNG